MSVELQLVMVGDGEDLVRAWRTRARSMMVGTEWKRLDAMFSRERDAASRELMKGAFYGLGDPPVEIEASYGSCGIVLPDQAAAIADILGRMHVGYLRVLGEDPRAKVWDRVIANEDDLGLAHELAAFYAEAARRGRSVLCGFI